MLCSKFSCGLEEMGLVDRVSEDDADELGDAGKQ